MYKNIDTLSVTCGNAITMGVCFLVCYELLVVLQNDKIHNCINNKLQDIQGQDKKNSIHRVSY